MRPPGVAVTEGIDMMRELRPLEDVRVNYLVVGPNQNRAPEVRRAFIEAQSFEASRRDDIDRPSQDT